MTWYDLNKDYLDAIYNCKIYQDYSDQKDNECLDTVLKANPFRQIVWKAATNVGFGYAKSKDGSTLYIVAWYDKYPKLDADRDTIIQETKDYSTVQ